MTIARTLSKLQTPSSTFEELRDVNNGQGITTLSGAGFLDFIKLFTPILSLNCLLLLHLVGFMHVVFEPLVLLD